MRVEEFCLFVSVDDVGYGHFHKVITVCEDFHSCCFGVKRFYEINIIKKNIEYFIYFSWLQVHVNET